MTLKSTIFNLERLIQSLERRVSQLERSEHILRQRVFHLEEADRRMREDFISQNSPNGYAPTQLPPSPENQKTSPSSPQSPSMTLKPTSSGGGKPLRTSLNPYPILKNKLSFSLTEKEEESLHKRLNSTYSQSINSLFSSMFALS